MALKILGQILTGASVVAVGVIVMGLPLLVYLWKEAGKPKRKGRNQFAADRGIDIDKDEFTPLEFCELCKNSYGGDVIRRLEDAYD